MSMQLPTIAVFSDAHGNLMALKKAVEMAENLGANLFVYLGDSIGYIPSVEALEFLRDCGKKFICVRGNHEESILNSASENAPGLSMDSVTKHSVIRNEMTSSQLAFIQTWPTSLTATINSKNFLFVHGSPQDPLNGYVYLDSDIRLDKHLLNFDVVFVANTHIPFFKKTKGPLIVNVGSVGLPRDHGRYGSFALMNTKKSTVQISRFSIHHTQVAIMHRYKDQIHNSVYEVFDRVSEIKFFEEKNID